MTWPYVALTAWIVACGGAAIFGFLYYRRTEQADRDTGAILDAAIADAEYEVDFLRITSQPDMRELDTWLDNVEVIEP